MTESTKETRPVDEIAPVHDEVGTAQDETVASADTDINSKRVTLADLSAKGTTLYAHKKYEDATEVFSMASILQAEINGETAPENAEILFHYGRSLFKVGQSKSDVLGGPAAAEKSTAPSSSAPSKKSKAVIKLDETETDEAKEGSAAVTEQCDANENDKLDEQKQEVAATKKRNVLFQFTGDENFDESDDEEEDHDDGDDQEEEEDDLATAFEILDLARVCYLKQLEKFSQKEPSDKGDRAAPSESSALRHIKERLAETHDALAEISLENERYPNAIEDGRVSLDYKMELYPEESEIVAEAHYKMSLALEFASITISGEDGKNTKREEMDQTLRDEAIKEMELAIKSFRLKMQAAEVEVATMASPEENEASRKMITEMKEVIADMEQRLVDLRKDPIDAKSLIGGADTNSLGGIFGAALGESVADIEARVEEAKKTAVDLTGLVRKKKTNDSSDRAQSVDLSGKRKAEDVADGGESPKKAKVDSEHEE